MNFNKIKKCMNKISIKITVFLFFFSISTLILNSIINNIIVSKYFSEIENQTIITKTEQSKKIFKSQISLLNSIVQDYAVWDDVYSKIQEKTIDEEWFDTNYTKWLPQKLNIDLIIVANRNKEIIHQYGLTDDAINILNDSKISQLFNENKYREDINFGGFKEYNNNLYLIGVCPIFQTNTEGTSQGLVILGRKISSNFIKNIHEMFGNDLFITYGNKFISSNDISKELEENSLAIFKNENNSIYELGDSKIVGSFPLTDISDNKIGYINVVQSRNLFLSTQWLMEKNNLLVMVISNILLFILGFKFKNVIVNPIKKLENQIKDMEHDNILVHVNIEGPNEIMSLAKSFNNMIDNIYEHKIENELLKINSNIDPLTGIYNHKCFFESINNLILDCRKKISLLFCDIDKFKLTNDTYGHETGNLLLIEIAKVIRDKVNNNGMVFRYGGEEFVVVLCEYDSEEAFIEAEEIRKSVVESEKLQKYAGYFPITLSIGIASYPNNGLDAESLISNADSAMYYSKHNGRNQCTIYNDNLHDYLNDCEIITKKELLIDSALSLAEAVDAKDHYTGKHSKMVSKYSILIAEKLNMSEEDKNKLRIGALLHDCGKIGIPDNIINKPDKLSDYEYSIIKTHPIIIHCIRSHHERWDGKGYPDGISGTTIHLFARIVCIADVFHSMASDRAYRRALSLRKVMQEFIEGRGTQFDPMLVDIIIEMIKEFQQSSNILNED
jgi:diguanylate cyclase (GGDEF)-like protein